MEQITSQEADREMCLFERDLAEKLECLQIRLQKEFDYTLKTLDENLTQTIHREIVNTQTSRTNVGKSLQIEKYDGTIPFSGFLKRFRYVSKYNGWDPQTKSKKFINAMTEEASLILQKHLLDEDSSYESLESVLQDEFDNIDESINTNLIENRTHEDNIVDASFSKNVLSAAVAELEFRNQIGDMKLF